MRKWLIGLGAVLTCLFTFAPISQAASEFSSDYNVSYTIDPSGVTQVSEQISLTNLTDRYYAKSFNLVLGTTKISDIAASDKDGPLQVETNVSGNKTNITVDFNSQIAGKDKVYTFTLLFKSQDFAQKQGSVWQISAPRISSPGDINQYNLTLSVPESFGDPTSILPEPTSKSESQGQIHLNFNKDQLIETGILANFGTNQLFDFNLTYKITNSNPLPAIAQVAIPSDTDYQAVSIKSINPSPENVTIDPDGNSIAWFKLSRDQSLQVLVSGQSQLYINRRHKAKIALTLAQQSQYTQSQQYWDKDSPLIAAKLADIFKDGKPNSVADQARLINQYVVDTLKYDDAKVTSGNFERLGAVTALNNPDTALCVEFTDLFVALARADKIAARELDGYAYTSNTDLRPLSFSGTILHAWPEYFDPDSGGWVMIDPTWQNTTGGVDYFSRFDLNHFVFVTHGLSSTEPATASDANVQFSSLAFQPSPEVFLQVNAPNQIFAGFPASLNATIYNKGTSNLEPTLLSINATQVQIVGKNSYQLPSIPPYGHTSFTFKLKTNNFWQSFDDLIELSISGQKITQPISVRPFYAFRFFPVLIILVILVMIGSYLLVLRHHLRK